jgi:hypothetical protein
MLLSVVEAGYRFTIRIRADLGVSGAAMSCARDR